MKSQIDLRLGTVQVHTVTRSYKYLIQNESVKSVEYISICTHMPAPTASVYLNRIIVLCSIEMIGLPNGHF